MQTVLLVVHAVLSVALIGLVLIQHGKGADAGAAFGSGASATVFGSRGAGSFLTRLTAVLATSFFVTSLALGYFAMQKNQPESVADRIVGSESAVPVIDPAKSAPVMPVLPTLPPDVPVAPKQ